MSLELNNKFTQAVLVSVRELNNEFTRHESGTKQTYTYIKLNIANNAWYTKYLNALTIQCASTFKSERRSSM
jgi:hypothetical protein